MNLEQNLFYFDRLCSSYSLYVLLAVKLFIYLFSMERSGETHCHTWTSEEQTLYYSIRCDECFKDNKN